MMPIMLRHIAAVLSLLALGLPVAAQTFPGADYVIRNFKFESGETLPELRMHYIALGHPRRDASGVVRNAVIVLHGTTGSGGGFTSRTFAGELFGPGQLLDTAKYYIVLPDGIGHGKSSKPSDGLRAHFPHYGYLDMVEAQYQLLTKGLGVSHARLVMGTSMGGMQTWLWGERHPDFMDALMPLASLPIEMSGRNRAWRKLISDAIRHDPAWHGGNYTTQPPSLRTAAQMTWLMGSNPVRRQREMPTFADANRVLDAYADNAMKTEDANDVLYQIESSHDYSPGADLEKIKAPLFAVNSEDDLINPPELALPTLKREIKRVPKGTAVVIPYSDQTWGHGSHTIAVLWKQYLADLLRESGAQ